MDDLDDPLPVPGLSDETSSSSSATSSAQTSPVVAAALGTVDEPSALSLPPAVKSLHTFHFNYRCVLASIGARLPFRTVLRAWLCVPDVACR